MITLDKKKFSRDAKAFAKEVNVSLVVVLRDQHRLWTADLIRKTPPATLSMGRKAVARDLNKLFVSIDDRAVLEFYKEDLQDHGAVPRSVIFNLSGAKSRMKWWHDRHRTGPRKTVKFKSSTVARVGGVDLVNEMYVPRAAFNKYLREKQSHVGTMKAGWVPAANHFGAKYPGWVGRQRRKEGAFSDNMDAKGNGALESINRVPWAPKRLQATMQATLKTRERDLARQAKKRLKALTDKENARTS